MRSMHIYGLLYSLAATTFFFLGACSDMNDLHDEYLRRGETIYVGKPDSVKIFAGRERVQLRYWSSDPKAAKMVVYWLSRTDSILLDIPSHLPQDPLDVIISDLPEYNHSFELVTMNADFRNRSVTLLARGTAYGAKFQSSLLDRLILSSELSSHQLEIQWLSAVEKGIGCEVEYIDTLGVAKTVFVPMTESTTLINDVEGSVQYKTLFLPEENAIDTFYTAFRPVPL